jgi:beta-glucanase (GH16 family)
MHHSMLEGLESRRLLSSSPIPGNWTLKWADEFNSTPALPTWVNTLWGTTHFDGELQNYTPGNVSVSSGIVNLTAKRETSNGFPYTSGLIDTGGDFATGGRNQPGFSFRYGYIEARMKLTRGAGLWPAFWMMPTPYSDGTFHDGDGEIDIMEQVGTNPTVTEAHLHHNGVFGKAFNTGVDLSAGFHTYGLDWQEDHLTWYFDGNPFYTVTRNVPNVAMYPILNLAVGDANSWPGEPNASTVLPQSFQIDYLRVYDPAAQTPLPGDADADGKVDLSDLAIVATNWGTPSGATWAGGDFTGDGKVDLADLGILASNWGGDAAPLLK